RAPRWPRSSPPTSQAWRAAAPGRCGAASMRCACGTASSGSAGSSSSPIHRWLVRLTCSTCCVGVWRPMDGSTGAQTSAARATVAPYRFLGQTTSLCETCLGLVPAKVIAEGSEVFYLKRCREHGVQKTLVSDDLAYWKAQKDWLKPGDRPLSLQTRTEHGCPY